MAGYTEKWVCGGCGDIYDTCSEAEDCCPPELIFECSICGEYRGTREAAENCCQTGGVESHEIISQQELEAAGQQRLF